MSKISKAFENGKAFIPFLTCGARTWKRPPPPSAPLPPTGPTSSSWGSRFLTPPPKAP